MAFIFLNETDVSDVLSITIIRTIALMVEALSICEKLVGFYKTTQRIIPQGNL
jgi:hypothetical protein